jgi:phospho-N-acetylmuramoyl-pentapeptide-transferase
VFLTACAFKQGLGINTVTAAMMGGLLGFLFYNTFPASVFMGDTGSLALGGFVASCAYLLQMPLFILLFGFIYLIEVISVILQVGYFKISHGKRIFKMAPIHHHFEKCGYKETKVVAAFTIVTVFACAIAYLAI